MENTAFKYDSMAFGYVTEDNGECKEMKEGGNCVFLTDRTEINDDIAAFEGTCRFYQVSIVDT